MGSRHYKGMGKQNRTFTKQCGKTASFGKAKEADFPVGSHVCVHNCTKSGGFQGLIKKKKPL